MFRNGLNFLLNSSSSSNSRFMLTPNYVHAAVADVMIRACPVKKVSNGRWRSFSSACCSLECRTHNLSAPLLPLIAQDLQHDTRTCRNYCHHLFSRRCSFRFDSSGPFPIALAARKSLFPASHSLQVASFLTYHVSILQRASHSTCHDRICRRNTLNLRSVVCRRLLSL